MKKLTTTLLACCLIFWTLRGQHHQSIKSAIAKELHQVSSAQSVTSAGSRQAVDETDFGDTPQLDWLESYGDASSDSHFFSLKTDNNGNIYSYGYASADLAVYGEDLSKGIFIAKQTADGAVDWIENIPCEGCSDAANIGHSTVVTRDFSSLYVAVGLPTDGSITVPDGPTYLQANGSIVIMNYDLLGNYIDSFQLDMDLGQMDMAVDYSGNLLITGFFSGGSIDIRSTIVTSSNSYEGFIAKLAPNGTVIWAQTIDTGGGTIYSYLVDADEADNIYLSGEIYASVTVGGKTATYSDNNGQLFMGKLKPDGAAEWLKFTAGDHDSDVYDDNYTWNTGLLVDKNGNMYIKGSLGKSSYFDDIHLENNDYHFNKFIAKFDTHGEVVWINDMSFGAESGGFPFDYNEFTLDELGNVYFGAQLTGLITFGQEHTYTPTGNRDLFVAKYTNDGEFGWLKAFPGEETGNNYIESLAIDGTETLIIGGETASGLTIDNGSVSASGFLQVFVGSFPISNEVPTFSSTPITSVIYQTPYEYQITAEDADELPTLTITSEYLPHWLSLTDHGDGSATLSGTPEEISDLGEFEITISVTDGIITTPVEQIFTLSSQILSVAKDPRLIGSASIILYPNPAAQDMVLQLQDFEPGVRYQIVNSVGQVLEYDELYPNLKGMYVKSLDLDGYPQGIYILMVDDKNKRRQQRFIKQ